MEPLAVTDRTRITRLAARQVTDRAALHALLDAALVAHVALVRDGLPVVLPLGCARDGDALLLHGSSGGGLLREAAAGAPLAVAVTLLDGLVVARSLYDSSMNYRSAVVVGTAEELQGSAKLDALRVLSEHLLPGRWDEVREPTARELAATLVLRVPLDEVGVKVRAAGAGGSDEEDDGVWCGVVPLALHAGAPVADPGVPAPVPVPASVRAAVARHAGA